MSETASRPVSGGARECTPPGAGGVTVLELRGALAHRRLGLEPPAAGAIRLVHPRLESEPLDEALLVGLPGDRSELHVHGSPPLVRRILEAVGRLGEEAPGDDPAARERSLEREAWDALPRVRTLAGARVLLASRAGALRSRLEPLLAAEGGHPTAGDPTAGDPTVGQRPGPASTDSLGQLLREWTWARWLQTPPRVVLQGPVNAGKSTLFNLLVGAEQALTSDEEGTTRDALAGLGGLEGWTVEWIDTAGERAAADDSVEAAGQQLGARLAAGADLVLRLDPGASEVLHRPGVVVLPARGDRTGAPSALAPLERPAEARSLVAGALREALGLPRDPRAALEDRGFAVVWAERQAAALESLAAGDPQPLRRLLRTRD